MKFLLFLAVMGVSTISGLPRLSKQFPTRIVGGSQASKSEFPWIVQIKRGGHYCGGSIVNANWIVTAAHCSVASISGYTVVAGEHNLTVVEGTEQTRSVSQIIIHSNYSVTSLVNDVAVWKLSSPLTLNNNVKVANLAPAGFPPTANVVVAGWGRLTEDGILPTILMKVTVPMVTIVNCRAAYGQNKIMPGMICAGTTGRDACQQDSGGPLHSGSTLVGIVSWGEGCANPNYPGVYSEVAYFNNWIRSKTG